MRFHFCFLLLLLYQTGIGQIPFGEDINGSSALDFLGTSLDMSSLQQRIVVGSPGNDENGENAGKVEGFFWNSHWQSIGVIYGEESGEAFGSSIAISDDGGTVISGAPNNSWNGPNAGATRIYSTDFTNYTQQLNTILGSKPGDQCGYAVDISYFNNWIIIGSPGADGTIGEVRMFAPGTVWFQLGQTLTGNLQGGRFGHSVSMSSNGARIAIGAPAPASTGQVSIYEFDQPNNQWNLLGERISGTSPLSQFGSAIALSADGHRIAVGSPTNPGLDSMQSDAGLVRVFEWDKISWKQIGQDLHGQALDAFGSDLDFDAEGNKLVVGAPGNSEGYVHVYEYNGEEWELSTTFNTPNSMAAYGTGVSITDDAAFLAIGAPLNDDVLTDAGEVTCYNLDAVVDVESLDYVDLQISPNPATNHLNIPVASGAPFVIYDLMGRKVFEGNIVAQRIDIYDLPPGYYVCAFPSLKQGMESIPFIKQ